VRTAHRQARSATGRAAGRQKGGAAGLLSHGRSPSGHDELATDNTLSAQPTRSEPERRAGEEQQHQGHRGRRGLTPTNPRGDVEPSVDGEPRLRGSASGWRSRPARAARGARSTCATGASERRQSSGARTAAPALACTWPAASPMSHVGRLPTRGKSDCGDENGIGPMPGWGSDSDGTRFSRSDITGSGGGRCHDRHQYAAGQRLDSDPAVRRSAR